MTEVPDYLLQRSRDRRAALGLGGGDEGGAGGDTGGESAPAATAGGGGGAVEAAPPGKQPVAVPAPPDPEPAPPAANVQAAMRRKRIPVWALPVLAFLPVWAVLYATTLEPPTEEAAGALELGAEVYGQCAACHGAGGGGGVGPAMADGAVLETFPDAADHVRWVRLGSTGWASEVGDTYGAADTPVAGGMPAFDSLTPEELLAVIVYERVEFGGEDPVEAGLTDAEGALLISLDEAGEVVAAEGGVAAAEE